MAWVEVIYILEYPYFNGLIRQPLGFDYKVLHGGRL